VLGAVALPRYFSVQNEAETSLVNAFAATLSRTVGHSLWSRSLTEGDNGSLKVGNTDKFYGDSLQKYVDIPVYFDKTTVDFSKCVSAGNSAQPFLQKSSQGHYNVFCRDGNLSTAPEFVATQGASYQF
jgi:hypothetical protein